MRRSEKGRYSTLNNIPVILDLGHWGLKGIVGDDPNRRVLVPHALNEMDRTNWIVDVESAGNKSNDYIQVGTKYYEVGETAQRHNYAVEEGVKRYQRTYYGVLMCHVIAQLFEPEEIKTAVVFASYPPGDRRYKDDLEMSLGGKWDFVHMGRHFEIIVQKVVTYAEPMGGFWNFIIQEDEQGHFDNPDYLPHRATLVLDFGGGTLSFLPIGKDHKPDFRMSDSIPIGFNTIALVFERELKAARRDLFRNTRRIPPDLLHEALRDGKYYGGGDEKGMDVREIVNLALSELLDEFRTLYQRMGGAVPYGQIILTGGGSAVLGERLKKLLEHKRVFYATDDFENFAFANVEGGLKAYQEMAMRGNV